jgi:hypothetical protein
MPSTTTLPTHNLGARNVGSGVGEQIDTHVGNVVLDRVEEENL